MPIVKPPQEVVEAFISGVANKTRRVELYEPDAHTRWEPEIPLGIKSGSVSVDHGRAERRTLELVLDNEDRDLVTAPGGLWYDKIIKVYSGIEMKKQPVQPRIAIINDEASYIASDFQAALGAAGYTDMKVFYRGSSAVTYQDVEMYDIIIANKSEFYDNDGLYGILNTAYSNGKRVLTVGNSFFRGEVFTSEAAGIAPWRPQSNTIYPATESAHQTASGWPQWEPLADTTPDTLAHSGVSILRPAWTLVAKFTESDGDKVQSVIKQDSAGGARFGAIFNPHSRVVYESPGFRAQLASMMRWINPMIQDRRWEVQIGEFMIDRLREPRFPRDISITGRDYAKKCMNSKYLHATQFADGITIESLIGTIAGAAGISKRVLPATGLTVNREFFFDKGVTRWDAMDEIAKSRDHEIYFDAQGYLTLRPMADPATMQPMFVFKTGFDGVLVDFEKSTSDTRLYNVVHVAGESSDQNILPAYGTAINDDPNSPTSVQRLGERVYEYTSSFITSNQQAQEVADSFLAVYALEEFDVSFDALSIPWLEAGDVVAFVDPEAAPDEPENYLFSSFNIPLELGPMSASAKRVVRVV